MNVSKFCIIEQEKKNLLFPESPYVCSVVLSYTYKYIYLLYVIVIVIIADLKDKQLTAVCCNLKISPRLEVQSFKKKKKMSHLF